MAKVRRVTLTDKIDAILTEHHVGEEMTGEDVRVICGGHDLAPKHPNGWGATINALVRRGRLVKTGAWRQMKIVTSHARVNPVCQVVA